MSTLTIALDSAFWIGVGAVALLLVLSAFFSGSETALTAASRGKLRNKADKGSRGAARALAITENSERLIGSVLLGNNLVNILAASLATSLFTRLFGESGVALATLVMTLLVLVIAEVLPKTYAISNPEHVAAAVSRPIQSIIFLFAPVVSAVRLLVRAMLRIFGVQIDPDSRILAVRDEIVGAIELGHSEGIVEREHRDRILGALDLAERYVEEIMLHRSEIEMIDANAPPKLILQQCLDSPHTRLPVYRDKQENIVGVVHAKALLRGIYDGIGGPDGDARKLKEFQITNVATLPYFVPETTTLDDQMREFLRLRTHFALVVDEYGSLRGLITLEDILEEIVGEITDEYDTETDASITFDEDGFIKVDGATTIRDLNRAMDWTLPDEDANTVAGLVIHEAETIPTIGQVFTFYGFRFEISAKEGNRITGIRIRPPDSSRQVTTPPGS